MHPGLVSITFRQLSPEKVASLAQSAGLKAIEWGGDVHVPHGDLQAARRVRKLTADSGLFTAAYGSYYRAGESSPSPAAVLDTAKELGAPMVRVWAGKQGSAQAPADYRRKVVQDLNRCAEAARERKLDIVLEWHGGTLTDTLESARALLAETPHVRTYWQPARGRSHTECLRELAAVAQRLSGLHVFSWPDAPQVRLALHEHEQRWLEYLAAASRAPGAEDMCALLEFVRDDEPRHLLTDAQTLLAWLAAQDA
jgi:hypothetical protein